MNRYYRELIQVNRALAKKSIHNKKLRADGQRLYKLGHSLTASQWESLTGCVPRNYEEQRALIDALPEVKKAPRPQLVAMSG